MEDLARGRSRYLHLQLAVPGYGGHDATFEYEEWYVRGREGWRLMAYEYELRFEPAPSGRWAEHWHDDVFHRHCEPKRGRHADHYGARPIQLFDARAELRRRYALGPDALRCHELAEPSIPPKT